MDTMKTNTFKVFRFLLFMAGFRNVSVAGLTVATSKNSSSFTFDGIGGYSSRLRATSMKESGKNVQSQGGFGNDEELTYEEDLLQFLEFYNQKQKESGKMQQNNSKMEPSESATNDVISTSNNDAECTSKDDFVDLCISHHNGQNSYVRDDNHISNEEAAEFFEVLCDAVNKQSCKNTDIPFHNLSVSLQLKFLKVVCPRDADDPNKPDEECVSELYDAVEKQNEFGVDITTENESVVNGNIRSYCDEIYTLSKDYHHGICGATPSPTKSPSKSPTKSPTKPPISVERVPTRSPTSRPTRSPLPPVNYIYSREFTYMMGVNDTNVLRDIVNERRNDIFVSTTNAIRRVLFVRAPKISETGIDANGQNSMMRILKDGIDHTYTNEHICTNEFVKSRYCIVMVSKVGLESAVTHSQEEVNQSIFNTMNKSMADESFLLLVNRNAMNKDDVKEIRYLCDGYCPPFIVTSVPFPTWATWLIAIGSTLCLLCCFVPAFLICRRRNKADNEKEFENDLILAERNFTDDGNDLYLDEEHFDDHDLNFVAAYQNKMNQGFKSTNVREKIYQKYNFSKKHEMKTNIETLPKTHTTNNDIKSTSLAPKTPKIYNGLSKKMEMERNQEDLSKTHTTNNDIKSTSLTPKTPKIYNGLSKKMETERNQEDLSDMRTSNLSSQKNKMGTLSSENIGMDIASSSDGDSDLSPTTLLKSIEQEEKLAEELDEAIHAGDWNAVTIFATEELAQHDDISAMSSLQESGTGLSYDPSETQEAKFEFFEESQSV